jgi:ferredoxin
MDTTIFWFSGTGNSLSVARQLADGLGGAQLVPMARANGVPGTASDRVGLVFPVYAFGVPRIVHEFARRVPIRETGYTFAVATMGGSPGGPHRQLRRILQGRGTDLAAGWSVAMPGNYTPLYGAPSDGKQQRLLEKARGKVARIADAIRAGTRGHYEDSVPPLSWIGAALNSRAVEEFRKAGGRFHVDPTCTRCGVCEKVCQVGNIVMKEGLPVWLNKCEQCMACLQWCPAEAIQFGRRTKGRRRYRHPDFKASDFFLRAGQ